MKKLLLIAFLFYTSSIYSNAINVTNLSLNTAAQEVSFDLQWENSWRVDSISAPFNWDAAWVFVKFAECDSTSSITELQWEHGKLNTNISAHTFNNLEPVLNNGTTGMADSLGVMLRRTTNDFFTNAGPTAITLNVNNIDPTKTYHIRVVAIEMVYVNQGAFDIGGNSNYNSFDSINITSENATTITSLASGANASIDLSANYPKGFGAFHCMKYEISSGQYVTFLNTIDATQSSSRFANTAASRNTITNAGTGLYEKYETQRPDRVANYVGWDDLLSYLDWSGLRPMTELQYEKACRGPEDIVVDEYAWGTTNIQNGVQFTGFENGTEFFVNGLANCTYNNVVYVGGDGGRGPARCGIFALPTNSTREQSGATHYGIMEMSGNVYEFCINVSSFTDAVTGTVNYTGNWGDGYLDATGNWDVVGWPPAGSGSGQRGGAYSSNALNLRLASRQYFSVTAG